MPVLFEISPTGVSTEITAVKEAMNFSAALRTFAADPNKPTREHIPTVVRTPNGNDYGKDLLRQHYLAHTHES